MGERMMHEGVGERDTPLPAVWFPSVRTGSGTDAFTERLAQGLLRRGCRVDVVWLPHRAEFAPWTVVMPACPPWANVQHVNSWLATRFLSRRLPTVATVHLCVHDPVFAAHGHGPQRLYHRYWIKRQERAVLRQSCVVTAVSSQTASQTMHAFPGVWPQVVHNGLQPDVAWATPRPPRQEGPFRLLYCGNWSRRKGVDLLEPLLRTLGSGFELLYTADRDGGTGGYSLPPNARSMGRLTGPGALGQVYRLADVLVFPSRLEGLPLVPIEAMACGLPIVATDTSSVVDIVQHGETGLLVAGEDVAGLAAAIVSLRDNPMMWAAMSEASRRRQLNAFNEEGMVEGYLKVYRQAMQEGAWRAAGLPD